MIRIGLVGLALMVLVGCVASPVNETDWTPEVQDVESDTSDYGQHDQRPYLNPCVRPTMQTIVVAGKKMVVAVPVLCNPIPQYDTGDPAPDLTWEEVGNPDPGMKQMPSMEK
jgi:hypothetical protein